MNNQEKLKYREKPWNKRSVLGSLWRVNKTGFNKHILVVEYPTIILYFIEGPYKRTQTAAIRQAKYYLPRQAAARQLITAAPQ